MRISAQIFLVLILANLAVCSSAQTPKRLVPSARILSASSVYFDDRTGVPAVGERALAQLKKWGRFRVVQDRKQADLIFLLSADAYQGGHIIVSGGQTGTVGENGNIQEDPVPDYNRQAPVRYAHLTVIDPKTRENLWAISHRWGGLLTGFNSVGERLIKELENQTRK